MKKESFISQLANIGIGTILTLIIGFFTTPIITRLVAPDIYGDFALFNTYSTLAVSFLSLGLDRTFIRYYYIDDNKDRQIDLFFKCQKMSLKAYSLFVLCVILLKATKIIKIDIVVLGLLVLNVVLMLCNRFLLLNLRVNHKAREYATLNCVYKIIYVIVALITISLTRENEFLYLASSVIVAAIAQSVLAFLFSIRGKCIRKIDKKQKTDFASKELIYYGLPLMMSAAVFSVMQSTDRIALDYFCPKTVVGIYASAQSLMSVFSIIQTTFNSVWGPTAIEKYENGEGTPQYYKKMNDIMLVIMFGFGIMVLLFKDLIVLLLGEKYREAAQIIPFLMFNPIMYTLSETTCVGIQIKKKPIYEMYVMLTACVTNILGNLILIQIFDARGAAISTGISYILFFTLRTMVSEKNYKIGFDLKKTYLFVVLFFACVCASSFLDHILINVISGILFLVILMALNKQTIKYIFKVLINFVHKKKRK